METIDSVGSTSWEWAAFRHLLSLRPGVHPNKFLRSSIDVRHPIPQPNDSLYVMPPAAWRLERTYVVAGRNNGYREQRSVCPKPHR